MCQASSPWAGAQFYSGKKFFFKNPSVKPESQFQERGRKYGFRILGWAVDKVPHFKFVLSLTGWTVTSQHRFCCTVIICREVVPETRCAPRTWGKLSGDDLSRREVVWGHCGDMPADKLPLNSSCWFCCPRLSLSRAGSARRWGRENERNLFSFHAFMLVVWDAALI